MLHTSREISQGHRCVMDGFVWLAVLMLLSASANVGLSQLPDSFDEPAQTFVVTSTSNSGPGTLRQAIMDANSSPGLDNITFNISGTGIKTITISSVLPTITGPVVLDGTTQPGYSGTPLILIHGSGTSEAVKVTAGGTTLKGLTFGNFSGTTADGAVNFSVMGGNVVTACSFGIRGDNVTDRISNDALVFSGISNNRVGGSTPAERNYFGADDFNQGVLLKSGASNNRITGNWFGVAPNGNGIQQRTSIKIIDSPNNTVGGTVGVTPGGACTGECNVITGNQDQSAALYIMGAASTGNVVIGNFVGLLADGHTPNANRVVGVRLSGAPNNRIGGTTAAERNVISANNTSSVLMDGAGANGNVVTGNYIGTDSTGMARSTTLGTGVSIGSGSSNTIVGGTIGTTVGGPCTGACNVISGNGNNGTSDGISIINSSGNVIDGNYIGLNAAGTAPMLNGIKPDGSRFDGDAIVLINASNNTIGRRSTGPLGPTEPTAPVYCVQDDDTHDYIKWDAGTHEILEAKHCASGQRASGTGYVKNVGDTTFILADLSGLSGHQNAKASVDVITEMGNGSFEFAHGARSTIHDTDVSNNGSCTCPPAAAQVVQGSIVMTGQGADSNDNFVGNILGGLTANGIVPFDLNLPRAPIIVQYGNRNDFQAMILHYRLRGALAEVQNGTDNHIDITSWINTAGAPPINIFPGANGGLAAPSDVVAQFIYGGARITGLATGPANATVRLKPYAIDLLNTLEPGQILEDIGGGTDVQLGPTGSVPFILNLDPGGADLLHTGDRLSVTSTIIVNSPNGLGSTSPLSVPAPVPNAFYDADGDGKTDIGVYRPGANVGFPSFFYTLRSFDNGFTSQQFGSGGDLIVPGDYNGDHVPDLGVWRVSNGLWYVADPVGDPAINFTGIQWGLPTDKPESGDYDGDGSRDLAVVRDQVMSGKPAVDMPAIWYIRNSLGGDLFAQQWGSSTDKFVPADYNGDGRTDLAVYRNGDWYISVCPTCPTLYYNFGLASDIPTPADYDGDGIVDPAVFRPATGTWYIQGTTSGFFARQWGQNGDVPLDGDFDGDGKNDIGVFRPMDGNWYILRSGTGNPYAIHWGQTGDIPVPSFEAEFHY